MVFLNDMDKLVAIAEQAGRQPRWSAFAEFCRLRGQGVRGEAFKRLDAFVDEAAAWDFRARLDFVEWVLDESRQFTDPASLLAHPAKTRLIVPTVREWLEQSLDDAQPHLWLGLLRCDDPSLHLERALELDPSCDLARTTLTQWILADVDYNQHELPAFYIHDPRDDLSALDQAARLVDGAAVGPWADEARREISELLARAKEWLAKHPGLADFAVH
jgi:hypothetical protein